MSLCSWADGKFIFLSHTHTQIQGGLGAIEQTELGHRSMSLRPKAIYTFHALTHANYMLDTVCCLM